MRPQLHFTAPYHWINDPNGLIYYQGKYHIFYQHFPYAPHWGTMHWGHAVTEDFIHFEHLPIALYPSKEYDRNGCFSGSAIEKDGQLYLYYTSIRYAKENPEYVHIQYSDDDLIASQSLLISDDGYHFDNQNQKQMIIDVMRDEKLGDLRHTRDPKVWKMNNGKIGMVIGSKIPSDTGYSGEALFYESEDGIHFEYKNRFVDDSIGDMWECPDVFALNQQYYMIFSPEHINQPPYPVSNAVYMPIDFDEDSMTIQRHSNFTYIDYGLDFYAPQTFINKDNQRMMLGWLRMREPVRSENWVGMFTMPRILTEKDNHIYQNIPSHIQSLFTHETKEIDFHEPFLLKVSMSKDSSINLGGFKLYIKDDCLYANREEVSIDNEKVSNINHTPQLHHQYELEVYYDAHVFEIFINNGYYVLSQVVYNLRDKYEIKNCQKYTILKTDQIK